MSLEADIVPVDDGETAQIGEAIRPAEAACESGRRAVAVASLIQGEHDIAASGELDRKAALSLP